MYVYILISLVVRYEDILGFGCLGVKAKELMRKRGGKGRFE